MNLAPAGRSRQIILATAAVSLLGALSVLIHQLFLGEAPTAFSGNHQISIMRTPPGPARAPRIPLGDLANALFTQKGKSDRADYAAAQIPVPSVATAPAAAADKVRFVSASMTPVDVTEIGSITPPHLPRQDVNRGVKADRLSVPQLTVAKLLGDDAVEAAGASTALFLLSPPASGEQPAEGQAGPSEGPSVAAAGALAAGKLGAPGKITWADLIKLARMNGGDGEDIKSTIFGGLTEKEFRAREFRCMATAIYFEARDEPIKGQIAVGQVIMNRLRSIYYPKTICGVVYQGQWNRNACQFSFACDGRADTPTEKKEWNTSLDVARKVISGEAYLPEIGDATHYHATYVNPPWKKLVKRVAKIGTHIFYRADFAPPLVASADSGKL